MAEPDDPSLPDDREPNAGESRQDASETPDETPATAETAADDDAPEEPAAPLEPVAETAAAEPPAAEPIAEPETVTEPAAVDAPEPVAVIDETPASEVTAASEPEETAAAEEPVIAVEDAAPEEEATAETEADWTLAAEDASPPARAEEPEHEPPATEIEAEPVLERAEDEPAAPAPDPEPEPEPVAAEAEAQEPEPQESEASAPEPEDAPELEAEPPIAAEAEPAAPPPEPEAEPEMPVAAYAAPEPEAPPAPAAPDLAEDHALFDAAHAEPDFVPEAAPEPEPALPADAEWPAETYARSPADEPAQETQPEEAPEREAAPIEWTFEAPPPEQAAASEAETPEPAAPAGPSLGDRIGALFAAIAAAFTGAGNAIAKGARAAGAALKPPPIKVRPPRMPRLHAPRPPNWRSIAIFSGVSMAVVISLIAGFFIYVTWGMPSTKDLWSARGNPSLTFVDRYGRVIMREGAQNAPPVNLDDLPKYVPEAVIAIEDRRFYKHMGVDIGGLIRASAANMKAGHVVQGGSTLTQQLAKNLFLTNERTWRRKAQEIALAFWLESQFSKKEILALYLSRVYFGAGAYGIDAASERYFDKPAKDLTLAEAALLAGLVKAPSNLNPARQDTAAKARAKIVLDEMLNAGYITAQQRAAALKAPLAISRSNPNGNLGYFRDWIDPQLNRVIGDQRDDFIIETTLDLEAQRAGEHALDAALDADGKLRDVGQGALLSMDSTGGVRAMVGGRSYGKNAGQSEFNRTTQSRRAPGSSFKYFIYMTAMAMGYTPWTVRVDQPIVIGDWAPGNYENKFYGPVTLTEAYAKSLNMVAIEVAHEVGGENVIATAQKLGVKTKLYNYRSLALGAQGLSLMEMVTSYGAMANDGVPIEPHGITRIRRASGQVLWAYRAPKRDPAIDERTKRLMNYLGSRVVQAGTGTRARIDGRDIAGKTGTSNDYRDAWFMGYVPGLVTGVWMGNDDYAPMKRVTGGSIPTQVWHDFMTVALRDVPYRPLDLPREEDMPQTTVVDATSALPPLVPAAAPMGAPLRPPSLPTEDLPPPPSRGGDG